MKFLKARKNILLLFVICITLLLSGCTNANTVSYSQTQTNITQSSSAKNKLNKDKDKKEETTEIKIIKPPEDGWTLEDLLSVTYIYGNQLTVPCTLKSLGKDFSFEKSQFSNSKVDNSVIIGVLNYNDSVVAVINIAESNVKDVNSQSTINRLIFNAIYSDGSNNEVTINGINLKSNKSQVIESLGEPDFVPNYVGEDYCYVYYEAGTENKLLTINFDSNDSIFLIDINLSN